MQRWSASLDRVVQADATEEQALRQLGIGDFRRAVVAIGASVEASVLTVLALVELGVPQIWARATSPKHAKILASVGAHHVIFPEAETGERVAHLIVSRMLDFIEFGDDFAIAKVPAPRSRWSADRLGELRPPGALRGDAWSARSRPGNASGTPTGAPCSRRAACWSSRAGSTRCSGSRRS